MNERIRFDPTGLPPGRPVDSPARAEDRGDPEARALLASMTAEELRAGLRKGLEDLALIDALDAIDMDSIRDDIGHPGRHPTRAYETWIQNDSDARRRRLNSAVTQVRAELTRRGETF